MARSLAESFDKNPSKPRKKGSDQKRAWSQVEGTADAPVSISGAKKQKIDHIVGNKPMPTSQSTTAPNTLTETLRNNQRRKIAQLLQRQTTSDSEEPRHHPVKRNEPAAGGKPVAGGFVLSTLLKGVRESLAKQTRAPEVTCLESWPDMRAAYNKLDAKTGFEASGAPGEEHRDLSERESTNLFRVELSERKAYVKLVSRRLMATTGAFNPVKHVMPVASTSHDADTDTDTDTEGKRQGNSGLLASFMAWSTADSGALRELSIDSLTFTDMSPDLSVIPASAPSRSDTARRFRNRRNETLVELSRQDGPITMWQGRAPNSRNENVTWLVFEIVRPIAKISGGPKSMPQRKLVFAIPKSKIAVRQRRPLPGGAWELDLLFSRDGIPSWDFQPMLPSWEARLEAPCRGLKSLWVDGMRALTKPTTEEQRRGWWRELGEKLVEDANQWREVRGGMAGGNVVVKIVATAEAWAKFDQKRDV